MRYLKNNVLLKLLNSYLIDASQPSNISYLWNFGSLLAICLGIQIISGVTLAMHYTPSVTEAFNSIEHIMRDVNHGWLVRYLHSNTASAFFLLVYLHIGRGIYYGSYRSPRSLVWIIGTIILIAMMPNVLGDSENYIMANPMQTPSAIVPEWYLLPFYAILRSIPNKLLGVIAMFSALLIILILPLTDLGKSKGLQFRPFSRIMFWGFVVNFIILMQLGAKHVESPFIELGQISTIIFFSYFIFVFPIISLLENTLVDISIKSFKNRKKSL